MRPRAPRPGPRGIAAPPDHAAADRTVERLHFRIAELARLPRLQGAETERPDRDTREAVDRVAHRLAHAPDLTLATLLDGDDQPRLSLELSLDRDLGRRRHAVLQPDPAPQAGDRPLLGMSAHLDAID